MRRAVLIATLLALIITIPLELAYGDNFTGQLLGLIDKTAKASTVVLLLVTFLANSTGRRADILPIRLLVAALLAGQATAYLIALYLGHPGPNDRNGVLEVLRLTSYAVIALAMGRITLDTSSIRKLLVYISGIGGVTAILAYWHSLTGSSLNEGRYVEGILRAGSGVVDSNILGAFLVLCSIAALALAFVSTGVRRITFLGIFVVCLLGRFWTFSTGSLISQVVGLLVFLTLWMRQGNKWRVLPLVLFVGAGSVFIWIMIGSGVGDTWLYRVRIADQYVYDASIGSRLAQYEGVWQSILKDPSLLITGVGTQSIWNATGTGFDFHNSFLRPLIVGGILAFACSVGLVIVSFSSLVAQMKRSSGDIYVYFSAILAGYLAWLVQAATLPADSHVLNGFVLLLIAAVTGRRDIHGK